MKNRIASLLKYNRYLYRIYYVVASCLVNLLKLFVKPDDRLILFNSFAGRNYDDSPKAIFEAMKKDHRFSGYRFVWAFHNPSRFDVEYAQTIETDSLKYFVTALKARAWITNSSVERGLNFKGRKTLYINTWHGTPLKKMGIDISRGNESFRAKGKNKADIICAQSMYEVDIFSRAFCVSKNKFILTGLPRNDILANHSKEERDEIRKRLNLTEDKTVILYCPTFREYEKDELHRVIMTPPISLKKWEKELGDKYVLLIRLHYEVAQALSVVDNSFVRDMTTYPNLNDLLIAADILISDYSSVIFDYSITMKPMLLFAYDYDRYNTERGMYFDIRKYISGAETEDELITKIANIDCAREIEKTASFRNKYVTEYGNATERVIDYIADNL